MTPPVGSWIVPRSVAVVETCAHAMTGRANIAQSAVAASRTFVPAIRIPPIETGTHADKVMGMY
jgi:hypothetical protein